VKTLCTN